MKDTIINLIILLLGWALFYVIVAFVKWDFNVTTWEGKDRFLIVAMGAIIGIGAIAIRSVMKGKL